MRTSLVLSLSIFCVSLNSQTFTLVEGSFTWQEAKVDAEARGGRLAVLNTQEKIDAANTYLESLGTWPYLWIGLSTQTSDASWIWIDGSNLTASNWDHPAEPSMEYGNQGYAFIYANPFFKGPGLWDDAGGSQPYSYLLEILPNETASSAPIELNNVGKILVLLYGWIDNGDGTLTTTSGAIRGGYAKDPQPEPEPEPEPDSDSDGVPDSLEITEGTDPNDAGSYNSFSTGLVAYYSFENFNDLAGDSTFTPLNETSLVDGPWGKAFRIVGNNTNNATGGYGQIDLPSDFPATGVTYSFWIYEESYPGGWHGEHFIDRSSDGLGHQWMRNADDSQYGQPGVMPNYAITGNGNEVIIPTNDGIDYQNTNSDFRLIRKGWRHYTVVADPSGTKYYVDGDLKLASALSYSQTGPLRLGYHEYSTSTATRITARYDNLRIYNRLLSSDEASAVYYSEAPELQIIEGNFTWQEAKADAEARGGRLAVLNTQQKIDATNNYLSSLDTWPEFYIGLTDQDNEGDWRWIDGTTLSASNWTQGEPSNSANITGEEDFAVVVSSSDSSNAGKWGDNTAYYFRDYIYVNTTSVGGYLLEIASDTDGDGLLDSVETNTGTFVSATDTGTDPNNADTDGDGISDGDEVSASVYELVSGSYSWEQARLDAVNRGGRLAVLSNENKLNQVMDLLVSEGDSLPVNRVWIGAQKVDGQWKWIDGTDWSLGFITPFLDPDGGQYYVELTTAENKQEGVTDWPGYAWPWDSQFGNFSTSYILEKVGSGTDPNNADSDGDGLSDGVETNTGTYVSATDTGTDPNNGDSDGDVLSDGVETNAGTFVSITNTGTDPHNADSDGDGLSDGDEVYTYYTDPNDSDTDDDGLSDGDEHLEYGTNPNLADSDADGLSDNAEITTYSTNPNLADTSGDGLYDGAVVNAGFTPTVDYRPLFYAFIQDARLGNSFIERAGDQVRLQLQIERSDDLESWSSDNSDLIQVDLPMTGIYNFFRFSIPSAERENVDEQ